jgi:hypothetical protein
VATVETVETVGTVETVETVAEAFPRLSGAVCPSRSPSQCMFRWLLASHQHVPHLNNQDSKTCDHVGVNG